MICPVCQSDELKVVNGHHHALGRMVDVERRLYRCKFCGCDFVANQKITAVRQGKSYYPIENADEIIEEMRENFERRIHHHNQTELWQD